MSWRLIPFFLLSASLLIAANEKSNNPSASADILITHEILAGINRLRANPVRFVKVLEECKTHFQGKELHMPGEITILTKEGASAVDEAINFLKSSSAKPAVRLSAGMSKAAADHVSDLGPRGAVGHYGSDKSSPSDRLNRHGTWKKTIGENISFGEQIARRVVIQLLIDDGVPDRGHRKNFFKDEYQVVGIACGKHTVYRQMCVIDFAGDYLEK
jgi:uncharacterized protein YkwD